MLTVGSSVILTVDADEPPTASASASSAPSRWPAPLLPRPIRSQLKPGGEGQVTFIVSRDQGAKEYEIELKGGYRLSAELAGGIKAMEGVVGLRLS